MKVTRILLVTGLLWGVFVGHQVFAKDAAWLYKPDTHNGWRTFSVTPGDVVPHLHGVRSLPENFNRRTLSATERTTVQRVVQYHAMFTPNDPLYPQQWNLPALKIPTAWDADQTAPFYGGDSRIIVAVLDTGLASTDVGGSATVPDFSSSSLWTNTGEIAGDGIDNDHDGYIDDVHGWNFFSNNNRPADDNGHGTHITNIIAAAMNNSVAGTGVASNVTIMPIKVLDRNGDGPTQVLKAGIRYAIDHGANIINLSLGGDDSDELVHQAIQNAVAQGIIVIGSSGNTAASAVGYPARYPEVISVGGTQTDNTRASYSNYGPTLDVVAPGDNIIEQGCMQDSSCASFAAMSFSGTSEATAQVSGVAALLESCGAAPAAVRSILTSTAVDLGTTGRDDTYGYGLVDATAALSAAGCRSSAPDAPDAIIATASKKALAPLVSGRSEPYVQPAFSWSGIAGGTYDVTWSNATATISHVKQTTATFTATVSAAGTYTLSVRTVDGLGRTSAASVFTYRYQQPSIVVSSGSTVTFLSSALKKVRSWTSKAGASLTISGGALVTGQTNKMLLSAQPNGAALVITDSLGVVKKTIYPFGKTFGGGISSTILQRADGTSIIVAATKTSGANIAWFTAAGKKLGSNLVFSKYTGGLTIAAGDLNADGDEELIIGQAFGARVRVYSADRQRVAEFFPRGKTFRQGWVVATGDTDGNGQGEIILTPNVGLADRKVLFWSLAGKELRSWKLTGLPKTSSVVLNATDMDGDGKAELLAIPQQGTLTLQRWSGAGKLQASVIVSTNTRNVNSLTSL